MSADLTKRTRQALAARNRSSPGKVSGKLLIALTSMIWEGLTRKQAAERSGMSEHGLWAALRRPHVRQWYRAEIDVLRTSERARNVHALVDVRDNADNSMARVNAVKTLEALDDTEAARGGSTAGQTPGLVIQVITTGAEVSKPAKVIEYEPLPSNDEPSE
jgi:hypothetical protein